MRGNYCCRIDYLRPNIKTGAEEFTKQSNASSIFFSVQQVGRRILSLDKENWWQNSFTACYVGEPPLLGLLLLYPWTVVNPAKPFLLAITKSRHLSLLQSTAITNIDRWLIPLQHIVWTGMESQLFLGILLGSMWE